MARRGRMAVAALGLAAAVAGCGVKDPYNDRGAGGATTARAAASTTTPAALAGPPASATPTPEAAIRAVALAWGNWTSADVHERHLRAIALTEGKAAKRLKAESRQIEDGVVSSPEDLTSRATVEAITLRPGADRRAALVVTREKLAGLGPLGSTSEYVVTLATVERRDEGWVVTRWERQS